VDDDCDGETDEGIVVTELSPDNGLTGGGTTVMLTGTGFTGVQQVTFGGTAGSGLIVYDDTSIEVVAPSGAVGVATVAASHGFATGTVTDGWTWTGTGTDVDSCILTGPNSDTTNPGVASVTFSAQVAEAGITDSPGPDATLVAEIGYGYQGWIPTASPDSYWWSDATFVADVTYGYEFSGEITPTTYGTYMVTFRFSTDGGLNWLYCDLTGGQPVDVLQMPQLDVVP